MCCLLFLSRLDEEQERVRREYLAHLKEENRRVQMTSSSSSTGSLIKRVFVCLCFLFIPIAFQQLVILIVMKNIMRLYAVVGISRTK